ncbi:MAG: cell division protein FtsQ/DivIB [Gammaproteobacteria bacterium]|nr:cell division protein FtsQ/DivIB [Gammaproteobacteria bacterium]
MITGRKQAVRASSGRNKQVSGLRKLLSKIKFRQLFYVSVVLLMMAGVYQIITVVDKQDILPIETVEIEGEFKYLLPEDLKRHALPMVQGGFFSVNLETIREALIQLPWVEDVSIYRQWPQALRIRIIEKQPVALWGDRGLISSRGELFNPDYIGQKLELPELTGLDGQHGNMLKQLGRAQVLLADLNMKVVKMEQNNRRSWALVLSTGFEVRLGRNDMFERLQKFVDVYRQYLEKQEKTIKYVDMRYTNGFAVAYKSQVTQGRGA